MEPEIIFACIACIAVGVGVIMYVLLRAPKKPASIGAVPSNDLGDEMPQEPETDEETADEATETAEDEEPEQAKTEKEKGERPCV